MSAAIAWFYAFFFGCFHSRTTFPLTVQRRTYVTCLDCGTEIDYSWERMRAETPARQSSAHAQMGKVAAVVGVTMTCLIIGLYVYFSVAPL